MRKNQPDHTKAREGCTTVVVNDAKFSSSWFSQERRDLSRYSTLATNLDLGFLVVQKRIKLVDILLVNTLGAWRGTVDSATLL